MAGPAKRTRIDRRRLSGLEVPELENQDLRRTLEAMIEHFRTYEGQHQPRERFVTVEDLVGANVVTSVIRSGFAEITGLDTSGISTGGGGNTFFGLDDTDIAGVQGGYFTKYNGANWVAFNFDTTPRNIEAQWEFRDIVTHVADVWMRFPADINFDPAGAINWDDGTGSAITEFLTAIPGNGDPYWDSVEFLADFNGNDGQTSYVTVDQNAWNLTFTQFPELSSDQVKFGTTSAFFDPYTLFADKISAGAMNGHLDTMAGAVAWTVEGWMYPLEAVSGTGDGHLLGGVWPEVQNQQMFDVHVTTSGEIGLRYSTTGSDEFTITSTGADLGSFNEWRHIAVCYDGTTLRMFSRGKKVYEAAFVGLRSTSGHANADFIMGDLTATLDRTYYGYLDDVRITVGVSRYTDDFIPPLSAFPTQLGIAGYFYVGDPGTPTIIEGTTIALTGPTTILDPLTVTGATQLQSTLQVSGAATLSSTLDVAEEAVIGDTVKILTDIVTPTPPTSQAVTAGLEFWDANETDILAKIGYFGTNDLRIENYMHGGDFHISGQDTTGAQYEIFAAGDVHGTFIYSGGEFKLIMSADEIGWYADQATATPPTTEVITFQHIIYDSTDPFDPLASWGFNGSNEFQINNLMHGGDFRVTAEDTAGAAKDLFTGDPDGESAIYYAGVETLAAVANGVRISHSGATSTNTLDGDGTDWNWAFANTTDLNITGLTRFSVDGRIESDSVVEANASLGATQWGFQYNVGGISSGLYHTGTHSYLYLRDDSAVAGAVLTSNGTLDLTGSAPDITIVEDDVTADNGTWQLRVSNEVFYLRALNDAQTIEGQVFKVERTGTTVDNIHFRTPVRIGAVANITDYGEFVHNGTDFDTVLTNTTDWNITGATGDYRFDQSVISSGSGVRADAGLQVDSTGGAGIYLQAGGAPATERNWGIDALTTSTFRMATATDADGVANTFLSADRTGTVVSNVQIKVSSNENAIICNADADVQLFYNNIERFSTASAGIAELRSDTNTDTETRYIAFMHQNATRRAFVGHAGAATFNVRNEVHGGNLELAAQDTAGTTRFCVVQDPDATTIFRGATNVEIEVNNTENAIVCRANDGVSLYFNAEERVVVDDFLGVHVLDLYADIATATPPTTETPGVALRWMDVDGGDVLAEAGYFGVNEWALQNRMHGSEIHFKVEDSGGTVRIPLRLGSASSASAVGFHNTAPIVKPTVTGSRGGNAALASLLTALANYGLIIDSST